MVQSPCQYVKAYRFGRASKISGYSKMTFFDNFGHFWLKIEPLCFRNLTQNPWDYKTRAQELTSLLLQMPVNPHILDSNHIEEWNNCCFFTPSIVKLFFNQKWTIRPNFKQQNEIEKKWLKKVITVFFPFL